MHQYGRKLMRTHSVYLESEGLDLVQEFADLVNGLGVGYKEFSKRVSEYCGISLHIAMIDVEFQAVGHYIFFKNKIDAMEFKLRFI